MLYIHGFKRCIITSMFLDSVPKSPLESDTAITELTARCKLAYKPG